MSAKPNAWGHEIRALLIAERADLARRGAPCGTSKRPCPNRPVVECSYQFRGPLGEAESARRMLCKEHGDTFADTYALTFPVLPDEPDETEPDEDLDEVAS